MNEQLWLIRYEIKEMDYSLDEGNKLTTPIKLGRVIWDIDCGYSFLRVDEAFEGKEFTHLGPKIVDELYAGKFHNILYVEYLLLPSKHNKSLIHDGKVNLQIEIGPSGVYLLELGEFIFLDKVILNPENTLLNCWFSYDRPNRLIYAFYHNSQDTEIIEIIAKGINDEENFRKLQLDFIDPLMKDNFLRRTQEKISAALRQRSSKSSGKNKVVKTLMNVTELADYLGVSKKTIYNWNSQGKLPKFNLLGSPRYRKIDIDEWLTKNIITQKTRKRK